MINIFGKKLSPTQWVRGTIEWGLATLALYEFKTKIEEGGFTHTISRKRDTPPLVDLDGDGHPDD